MANLDFEIEVRQAATDLEVAVLRSPAGEAREAATFPFDELALKVRLQALEIALLRSGTSRRRLPSAEEQAVRDFGKELFDWLFAGEVGNRYDRSRDAAQREGSALRIKLRVEPAALAALPWEFLYDSGIEDYVRPVTEHTPRPLPGVVRAHPAARRRGTPTDAGAGREPERPASAGCRARATPRRRGDPGSCRARSPRSPLARGRHLARPADRSPPGRLEHLSFRRSRWIDDGSDEGIIALVDDGGGTFRLGATELARLLGDHQSLRLAVLNACEGAKGSEHDLFASTAATLVRRGTPAVVAMQYEITDRAAIEFSRAFYEAIADGVPVDVAMSESRKAVSVAIEDTLEWGTPVLYLRAPDGVLFTVDDSAPKPRSNQAGPGPGVPVSSAPSHDLTPDGQAADASSTPAPSDEAPPPHGADALISTGDPPALTSADGHAGLLIGEGDGSTSGAAVSDDDSVQPEPARGNVGSGTRGRTPVPGYKVVAGAAAVVGAVLVVGVVAYILGARGSDPATSPPASSDTADVAGLIHCADTALQTQFDGSPSAGTNGGRAVAVMEVDYASCGRIRPTMQEIGRRMGNEDGPTTTGIEGRAVESYVQEAEAQGLAPLRYDVFQNEPVGTLLGLLLGGTPAGVNIDYGTLSDEAPELSSDRRYRGANVVWLRDVRCGEGGIPGDPRLRSTRGWS